MHAAYSDDMELQMLCQLREALAACTRGPQLESLWSAASLPAPVAAQGLNPPQAQALAVMTTRGGAFVWGPPGTGKTKVIVAAVSAALAAGQSVLIASHTHVAVDNVVADVAQTVTEPGTIIRVGRVENFTAAVAEHEYVTLDKAAAQLTNRAARLSAIDVAAARVRDDPARGDLVVVEEQVAGVDLDADHVQRALAVQRRLDEITRGVAELDSIRADATADAERYGVLLEALGDAGRRARLAIEEHQWAAAAVAQARRNTEELQQAAFAVEAALAQTTAVRIAAENRPAGLFGRRRAQQDVAAVRASEGELVGQQRRVGEQLAAARTAAVAAERVEMQARADAATAHQHRLRRDQHLSQVNAVATQMERLRAEQATVRRDLEAELDGNDDLLTEADALGLVELLTTREVLTARNNELDNVATELEAERSRLADEFEQTRRQLLEAAPVIACTLAGLTTVPELVRRRFDVVIIDEAASAGIGQLIYAGAKSDTTLVYVGDFLQNEPIGDVDDAVTEDEQRMRRWQVGDIFGLLGVRDRATAEANPRCVALRTQYRYPPVIAGIVNDFCYDGLLESAWHGAESPPHVIFLDTTGHPEEGLRRSAGSWTNPLGLELLRQVCRRHQHEDTSIGLLCPYKAHSAAAISLAREERLPVEAGTSHKFQGRQFPVVVFDLMQDAGRARWVAGADLAGSGRQVQAAKLLNVGITRAQRTLYLVGDWSYIAAQPTPGMRAIRVLEGHPHFVRVSAAVFLTNQFGDLL